MEKCLMARLPPPGRAGSEPVPAERPLHPDAPQVEGTGGIRLESADRASGYFTTREGGARNVNTRTAGVYLRADAEDLDVLDGRDDRKRAELIAERLRYWASVKSTQSPATPGSGTRCRRVPWA
jgi:hypothetical protein